MGLVAVIGTMIGATFTTDFLAVVPSLGHSMIAMVVFVVVAIAMNHALFRKLARYDRTTAIVAAMPDGLVEAVILGEQAGGDVRVPSVRNFGRIVLVAMNVPLLFPPWTGEAVGSASGLRLEQDACRVADMLLILMLAVSGMVLGPTLRLPAHMVGPNLLCAPAPRNRAGDWVRAGLGVRWTDRTPADQGIQPGGGLNSCHACARHRPCIDAG
ncbi:MAG: AbrB family transcriptional regulator [Boseongicola sp.]|nr:AbrB family transcriptional regulator [Boseongicola sp.]